jgi:peptidoglycan/LPS O-acetylase OafA/YrhL
MEGAPVPRRTVLGGPDEGARRLVALDGLRGVAALVVLAYHLEDRLAIPGDRVLPGGFIGVDLFFALSGYLITWHLLAHRTRWGHVGLWGYAWKRAARLVPLLALFLLVAAAYEWSGGTPGRDIAWSTLANAAFLPGILTSTIDYQLTFTTWHLWSLIVEVHFYVLIPLLVAAVLHDRRPAWLAIGALAGLVALVAVSRHGMVGEVSAFELYARTSARIDTLLVGAAVAVVHRRVQLAPRVVAIAGWTGLGLLCMWALTLAPTTPWLPLGGYTVVAVAAAALVLATASDLGPAQLFAQGPLAAVGRVSYGVYVWHALAIAAVLRWLGSEPWPVQAVVAIAGTAALTALSWRFIESPALAQARAHLGRAPAGVRRFRRRALLPTVLPLEPG